MILNDVSFYSSTLGSSGNSPSALFIASDGDSLRVYQAVIDARTLLADNQTTKQREVCTNQSHQIDEFSN